MRLKAMPPPRLILALILMLAPLLVALVLAVRTGGLSGLAAFGGGALGLAGAVLAVRGHHRDIAAVTDYANRLGGESGDVPATPPGVPSALAGLTAAVARLHRVGARRTERVQAQLDANASIFDALHDPLLLIDAERQVTRANLAARGLFGDKVVGRELASTLRNPNVLEAVDSVLRGGASRVIEFTLPVPVERTFEAQVKPFQRTLPAPDRTLDPVPNPGAEAEGPAPAATVARMAILTLHDVTAARRSEQMRADFIANASHELRTPLSSLLGFIETLRGPARDDSEAQERFLSIMQDQASRMTRLVSDLLSLSRIELDEHMPPNGRVDVVEELENVIASLELKAAQRRIRLRLDAPEGLPAVIGDQDQLTQVFLNLVSNAIKYTREDTDVTVSAALVDGAAVGFTGLPAAGRRGGRGGTAMVSVAVRDQGDGIARTHLPRLTERFYRVDAARSRAMGGTGLGLAIVKHILNRHRGRLTIESEVGVGSAFTAYLPAAAPSLSSAADGAAAQAERRTAG
ncbi:ATP-binding protein [Azospirillum agricola]|uniref:ATP-binding protein n=1 Tax=Azospirillum agricola TaxID=1720247 RepID=UPI000A0F009D|nr:ATP-binding protein [Azospirillum agricola]SMH55658.1 two-component system, OmpR family, phosphate regulon sensor histidine kinase PhoR [Azospirillum lipoferum]